MGVDRRKPLRAMRETVEASRQLLAMERVTYHGEFVHLDDVEIDIVHGDRSPKDVPIYIGATGMKMMELAGEIADGVVLNYMVGPALQPRALGASGRARRGPGGPSRTSTGRSWSSARSTTTATSRSTAPGSCSPSTSGSSRTS